MNAMTPADQRRTLEARIAALEHCLQTHGLMRGSLAQTRGDPNWIPELLDERRAGGDGRAIVRRAIKEEAEKSDLSPEALLSISRVRAISWARQRAMLRAKRGGATISQIGRAIRMDHTSVIYGINKAKEREQGH